MRGEYGMFLAVAYVQGSADLSLVYVRPVSARCWLSEDQYPSTVSDRLSVRRSLLKVIMSTVEIYFGVLKVNESRSISYANNSRKYPLPKHRNHHTKRRLCIFVDLEESDVFPIEAPRKSFIGQKSEISTVKHSLRWPEYWAKYYRRSLRCVFLVKRKFWGQHYYIICPYMAIP